MLLPQPERQPPVIVGRNCLLIKIQIFINPNQQEIFSKLLEKIHFLTGLFLKGVPKKLTKLPLQFSLNFSCYKHARMLSHNSIFCKISESWDISKTSWGIIFQEFDQSNIFKFDTTLIYAYFHYLWTF